MIKEQKEHVLVRNNVISSIFEKETQGDFKYRIRAATYSFL